MTWSDAGNTRVVAAASIALDGAQDVVTPSARVADALRASGITSRCCEIDALGPHAADAIALLDDELSLAGEHAEGLVATVVSRVRPGGIVVVSARGAVAQQELGGVRGYLAAELRRVLGHHGIDVTLLCAPGAAGIVRGDTAAGFDPELDRVEGLLDAAPRLVAAGRAPTSGAARSRAFFATLPYKIVAAAVLCRDSDGRVLVVHDTFKQHWTIPGGVVDADEDPRAAAEREAWEEAGVRVTVGAILGVFSAPWPDRVVLVYEAAPEAGVDQPHQPVHAHEIDQVAWWPLDEALRRLAGYVAEQVRHCVEHPGGTLRQGWA